MSSQFKEEFLDGRKGFVFSWDEKHRPIHEEALLHYFDPSRKGQKFEYQPPAAIFGEPSKIEIDESVDPSRTEEIHPIGEVIKFEYHLTTQTQNFTTPPEAT